MGYQTIVGNTGTSPLVTGGTVSFAYPSGYNNTIYPTTGHTLAVEDTAREVLAQGTGFSVQFGTAAITVTYLGGRTLAANTLLRLGLTTLDVPSSPSTGIMLPTIAFVGDSIQAATILQDTALSTFNANRGPSFWVPFLSKQRVFTNKALNFGVTGNRTDSVLARITPIINSRAGIYYVAIGTNDLGVNSYDTIISNLQNIWNQLLATGAVVIASTILPRTLAGQASRDLLWRVNRWIVRQQFLGVPRFYVVDPSTYYGDPTATDASPRTNYSYDGLHPTFLGSYWATKPLVDLINQLVPAPQPQFSGASDAWSAANPTGNLATNPILAGTAGTNGAGGGTISGSVADSWTVDASANGGTITSLTVTNSKVTQAVDGRVGQRIVIGGSITGAGSAAVDNSTLVTFTQDLVLTGKFSVGDILEATADVEVASGAAAVCGIEHRVLATMGGQNFVAADGASLGDNPPSVAFNGSFRTPPLTVTVVPTLVRLSTRVYLRNGAQSPVLDFTVYSPALRKLIG